MHIGSRKLLVVGDRVLVTPEAGEERTKVGLVLPSTAVEKDAVQGGRIVEVGPGMLVPTPGDASDEPWRESSPRAQYVPMQAEVGDFALYLRNAATEISFEGTRYLVVPQAAILLLVRDDLVAQLEEEMKSED